MQHEIQKRLATLQAEYHKGQERLRELRQQETEVRETLLRIEGAMMVLRELKDREQPNGEGAGATHPVPPDDHDAVSAHPAPE